MHPAAAEVMTSWLLANTLEASGLAVLVGLAARMCRLAPATRHALWLVVLIKLVSPPLLAWPWQADVAAKLFGREASRAATFVPPHETSPTVTTALSFSGEELLEPPVPEAPVPAPIAAGPRVSVEAGPARTGSLASQAMVLWLFAFAAMSCLQLLRIVRLWRLTRGGRPAPEPVLALVVELARKMDVGLPRAVTVRGIGTPLVWSLGGTFLLLPEGFLERLGTEHLREGHLGAGRWRAVIAHELAHLKRRDHWVGWLLLATSACCWWHPLHAIVRRRLEESAEQACDAWVVWALPESRREFAETLIEVSRLRSRDGYSLLDGAPMPALRRRNGARRALERRLIMILQARLGTRLSLGASLGIGLLALMSLPSWSLGQAPKADSPPPPSRESSLEFGLADSPLGNEPSTPPPPADPSKPEGRNAGDDRDRRLAELERKLEALFEEVRALRGPPIRRMLSSSAPSRVETPRVEAKLNDVAVVEGEQAGTLREKARDSDRSPRVTTQLSFENQTTRTIKIYHLPDGKAKAFVQFLREQEVTGLQSVAVTEDERTNQVIIEATADAQRRIGQFIELLQGKPVRTGDDSVPLRRRSR